MDTVEVKKIESGSFASGFHPRGVVVEFAVDGALRRRQFKAAHLIDALQEAGLHATEISPPTANLSRLFVTTPVGNLAARNIYDLFRNTDGIDVSAVGGHLFA